MSTIDSSTSTRSRRRLAVWAAFGVAGLAAGAVWATGFATIGGANSGTTTPSPALGYSTPGVHSDPLKDTVKPGSDPVYKFDGFQGSIDATSMFTVDLSGQSAGTSYNVETLLGTAADLTGWASIQLELDMVPRVGANCSAADFPVASPTDPKVMRFDSEDARVGWTVDGGAAYCIGLRKSDGGDTAGTWLQSASETQAPTAAPTFITTVDQAS